MSKSRIFVLSGPSGSGKSTIAKNILLRHPELTFSISVTTRPMRPDEIDGKDYFFISKEEFGKKISHNELIEWETIYGEYYGTPESEVDRAEKKGQSILFDIDVNGALSVKNRYGDKAILIFIKPPGIGVLLDRLRQRSTETKESLKKRRERFNMELERSKDFDHCVVNDVLENAISDVEKIIGKFS